MNTLIEKIINQQINKIERINLGLSNNDYNVNDLFFVRIPKNKKRPDYEPLQEYLIEEQIGKQFHPSINNIYFDKESGIKVCNLISNFIVFDNQNIVFTHIRLIAHALKSLHSIKIDNVKAFNPIEKIKSYKKYSSSSSLEYEEQILQAYSYYQNDEQVLCHNDLVPGNILFIDKRIELIDYEYASLNDPFFDLASFISENNIKDPIAIRFFLEQYFKTPIRQEQYQKLNVFINLNNLLWYYWALMMHKIDNMDIYLQIAQEKKENLDNYFNIN